MGMHFTMTHAFSPWWWRRHGQAVQCMKAGTDGTGCLCSGTQGCGKSSRTQVPSSLLLPVRSHLLKGSQALQTVTPVGNASLCEAFQTLQVRYSRASRFRPTGLIKVASTVFWSQGIRKCVWSKSRSFRDSLSSPPCSWREKGDGVPLSSCLLQVK